NNTTFYKSAVIPRSGDHFTVTFKKPQLVYSIEVLTGINRRGLLNGGQVQVSPDGKNFTTIGRRSQGARKNVVKEPPVRSVRLLASARQSEPLVVRAINLRLLVEVSGAIRNPNAAIGTGNLAVTKGNTDFISPIGACIVPVINRNFTLKLNNGGNPCT